MLTAAANLTWVGQAYLLASAVGALREFDNHLLEFAAGFAALIALKVGCDGMAAWLTAEACQRIQLHARARLLRSVAGFSPLDWKRPHSGEISTAMTEGVESLGPYITRYTAARLRMVVVPVAIWLCVVAVSWLAGLILIVAAPVIPVFMALIGREARTLSLGRLRHMASMNTFLLDRLQAMTAIRVFGAVDRAADGLARIGEQVRAGAMAVLRVAFVSSAVLELFAALGVAGVAVFIGFSLLGTFSLGTYGAPLTLAEGLFILLLAPEFFQPMRDFAAAYHDRAAALAAAGEIDRISTGGSLHLVGAGARTPALALLERAPLIELDGVGLRPSPQRPAIFRNLALTIHKGEHVALVGPSGSGKSMLLGLVGGLLQPTTGDIRMAGHLLDDATADAWRRRLGWIPQRPGFVHGSVRANLALGHEHVPAGALETVVDALSLRGTVERLPRGLATLLGETGAGISGGEAQRLALARTALADADVILADEPTEHLDAETADAVLAALVALAQDRTLIVATHDPRVARRMRRVVDVTRLERRPAELVPAAG